MNVAVVAIIANAIPEAMAIIAGWHLVRTGRLRLASPTAAQLQAEKDTGEGNGAS